MKKLRIAQVTNLLESVPPTNQHGLEELVANLTNELVDLGHDVTLFATADSKTRAKLIPLWPTAPKKSPMGQQLPDVSYSIWAVSEAFARAEEFDIIHDHTRFVAAHFSRLIDTPIISTLHHPIPFEIKISESYPPDYQLAFKKVWYEHQKGTKAVVVSNYQANAYEKIYGFPPKVVLNGMNLGNWGDANPNQGKYLAFLGYITPDKGVSEAIQAVLPTNERLLIAGPLDNLPQNQDYFNEKIKPFLSERIKYVGPLEFEQKKEFLRQAKATLMPIQWDEPFGLVAIESLASGTPVIAWNRAALPEIIEDGISGFLVNSVPEMTERISDIGKLDRSLSRKRVEDHFSATLMAKRYEELYYSLIK